MAIESRIHRPAHPLSAYVDCLWYRRGFDANRKREYSLPSGSVDLTFNLHEGLIRVFCDSRDAQGTCVNGAVVHGAQSKSFVLDARKHVHVVGVHFRPAGACLLGLPGSLLTDRHVALEDVWGSRATELRERLLECLSPSAMFGVLERSLLSRLNSIPRVHPIIGFAVRSLAQTGPVSRVASVQRASGYGARRFSDVFKQSVGLSPKTFARVQRLRGVAHALAETRESLAEIALANGYVDQAHLTRDFRGLVGVTPSRYCPGRHALHMPVDDCGFLQDTARHVAQNP